MKRICFSLLLTAVLVTAALAAEPVSRRDAARLQAKLDRLTKSPGERERWPPTTPISEAELNSYLRLELGDRMPAGVTDPWVSLLERDRLSGSATVDLARMSESRKSTQHARPVQLPQRVRSRRRQRRAADAKRRRNVRPRVGVDLRSAVPLWMLQEIVTYYSKSPSAPNGVSIDKPFMLPLGIREIQLAKGQAIVVQ